MNLRVLKKKSKQAAPLIDRFYRQLTQEIFIAERGVNYHGLVIRCKHKTDNAHKRVFGKCECEYHPLKGTPMVGGMQGYYEPEWHEETAFGFLYEQVIWGNRPEQVGDVEWDAMLRITGLTPELCAEHDEWVQEYASG